jgi:hypothetical protein
MLWKFRLKKVQIFLLEITFKISLKNFKTLGEVFSYQERTSSSSEHEISSFSFYGGDFDLLWSVPDAPSAPTESGSGSIPDPK